MKVLTQTPASQKQIEPFVGVKRVAEFLGRSYNYVYEMSHRSLPNPIPNLKRGKYLFYRLSQVQKWLEETAEKV